MTRASGSTWSTRKPRSSSPPRLTDLEKKKPASRRVFRFRRRRLRLSPRGLAKTAERLQVRHEFLEPLDSALLGAHAPFPEVGEQTLVARMCAFPKALQLVAELQYRLEPRMPLHE